MTTYTFSKHGATVTLDVPDDLGKGGAAYVRDYGLKQTLQDSYAGAKNAAEFEGAIQKRLDAILAGTMKIGGSTIGRSNVSKLERLISDMATARVKEAAVAKGWKLKKDVIDAHAVTYAQRFRAELEAEAQLRIDRDAQLATQTVDIFAELFGAKAEPEAPTGEPEPVVQQDIAVSEPMPEASPETPDEDTAKRRKRG